MRRDRRALPPIDDELTQAPRRRIDLRGFHHRNPIDDAAVETNSRTLGERWGASTSVRPDDAAVPATPIASLRLEIPDYLDHELTLAAAQQRVTKGFLVMSALAKAGYRIEANDLVPDRRKVRTRKV